MTRYTIEIPDMIDDLLQKQVVNVDGWLKDQIAKAALEQELVLIQQKIEASRKGSLVSDIKVSKNDT